jgi:mono/diheme cytochrome c family protein
MRNARAHSGRIFIGLIVLLLIAAPGVLSTPVEMAAQGTAPVTFTKDIAPILQRSCQNCHGPQGFAPMPLTTYEEVRPWATAIKRKTSLREMPPWFIEKNIGVQKFKDDPSLSDDEIALIAAWVDGGARRGDPKDMPPPRQFAARGAWTLGTPDLVVSSPAFSVRAVGADWHGVLDEIVEGGDATVQTNLTEERWVKSIEVREFRPGEIKLARSGSAASGGGDLNLFTIHHAQVQVAQGDRAEGGADENSGPRLRSGPAGRLPRGTLSYLYEVGQNPMIYPEDLGILLPAGAKIEFPNNHIHSIGREVKVQIQVGITFHPKGFTPRYARGLSMLGGSVSPPFELDIPAGQDNVRYDNYFSVPQPVRMVTYEPHLHSSGKRMCVEAISPTTGFREMLNCSRYNHNWVKAYVYDDDAAPLLPAGTIVHVIAWFDNTRANPRVVDPRNWKGFGQRSIDDMFLFLSKFLPLTEEEFKAEVAAREAKQRVTTTGQNNQ